MVAEPRAEPDGGESDAVILDPSMLLGRDEFEATRTLIDEHREDTRFFVSDSFAEHLADGRLEEDYEGLEELSEDLDRDPDEEAGNLYVTYGVTDIEDAVPPEELAEMVDDLLEGFDALEVADDEDLAELLENLAADSEESAGSEPSEGRESLETDVLRDEAAFMFTRGPLLSTLRRPFRRIRDAGAGMLEFGNRTVGKVVEGGRRVGEGGRRTAGEVQRWIRKLKGSWAYKKKELLVGIGAAGKHVREYLDAMGHTERIPPELRSELSRVVSEASEASPELVEALERTLEVTPTPETLTLFFALRMTEFVFVLVDP